MEKLLVAIKTSLRDADFPDIFFNLTFGKLFSIRKPNNHPLYDISSIIYHAKMTKNSKMTSDLSWDKDNLKKPKVTYTSFKMIMILNLSINDEMKFMTRKS